MSFEYNVLSFMLISQGFPNHLKMSWEFNIKNNKFNGIIKFLKLKYTQSGFSSKKQY